ncbi:hypothetical protein CDD83_2391 [Cordyceps sp. RAO-2017]|nr:hypothetical protein CDD83_2391 [Cordyceps sp. RAO-2017]
MVTGSPPATRDGRTIHRAQERSIFPGPGATSTRDTSASGPRAVEATGRPGCPSAWVRSHPPLSPPRPACSSPGAQKRSVSDGNGETGSSPLPRASTLDMSFLSFLPSLTTYTNGAFLAPHNFVRREAEEIPQRPSRVPF